MELDNPDLIDFRRQDRANLGLPAADDTIVDDGASEATLRASSWSAWSTPAFDAPSETMGPASIAEHNLTNTEIDMTEASSGAAKNKTEFIIATDFGTTFSSVAFAKRKNGRWGDAQSITNYPSDPMPWGKSSLEVPTESWYPKREIPRHTFGNFGAPPEEDDAMADIYNAADNAYQVPDTLENISIGDDDEEMMEANTDVPIEDDGTYGIIWGYDIQDRLKASDMDHSQYERVARSKLILDNSENTQTVRDDLEPILRRLKRRKTIHASEDLISDYLTRLFQHAKDQLTKYHGFSDGDSIEHVLCVPNVWSPASSRKMQKAMEKAICDSGLGSMENLFIVAEPEAAAAYVLQEHSVINPEETFLIVDAGGGTVDLTTYTVHKSYPLRLKAEATVPTGGLYGSSFLNEAYREHLKTRLEGETYLEARGFTIDGIVDAATIEFENRIKRTLDITKISFPEYAVPIQGLLPNKQKNFIDHRVIMQRNDYLVIFSKFLVKIFDLVSHQLSSAINANHPVKNVILIGGFGGSPSLRNFLRIELLKFAKVNKTNVRLSDYRAPETAVALGAILRASNKEYGPKRIARSSYGFLRVEEYDPENIPAHKEARPRTDKIDGKKYVRNTILWLVKMNNKIPPFTKYVMESLHTFSTAPKTQFLCLEIVYVSDTSTESHFRETHPMNRGAERVGRIIVDMTFLRDQGIIQPEIPEPGSEGKPHYKVEIELVMIIDGRNLRYEARWPIGGGGSVQGRGQICIAAAFVPGTK